MILYCAKFVNRINLISLCLHGKDSFPIREACNAEIKTDGGHRPSSLKEFIFYVIGLFFALQYHGFFKPLRIHRVGAELRL